MMLSKHSTDQREQLEVVALSELVPEDHLVRKMEEAVDFSFIYEKVAPLYSSKGRPSINPVALIKMVLIQYVFGHRSMRETIERLFAELKHNHGLRWTTLRGKKKLSMQAMLVFAAMNLKNWRIGRGKVLIAGFFIEKTK